MTIRRPDVCAKCGVELAAGSVAVWFRVEQVVRCVGCDPAVHEPVSETQPGDQEAQRGVVGSDDVAVAGRSAQLEYQRRVTRERERDLATIAADEAWRASIRSTNPIKGRVVAVFTPRPTVRPERRNTTAWATGATGEQRVAEVLAAVPGIRVLHDRRIPRSRANIDHLVIGPSGVFVIDAKKYTGRVETRDVGGWFRSDVRLYVNGRDRTRLLDGIEHQVAVVIDALASEFAAVPVRGVLCFIGAEWGLIMRPKQVGGISVVWPRRLPQHVTVTGPHSDRIDAITAHLASAPRPAAPP